MKLFAHHDLVKREQRIKRYLALGLMTLLFMGVTLFSGWVSAPVGELALGGQPGAGPSGFAGGTTRAGVRPSVREVLVRTSQPVRLEAEVATVADEQADEAWERRLASFDEELVQQALRAGASAPRAERLRSQLAEARDDERAALEAQWEGLIGRREMRRRVAGAQYRREEALAGLLGPHQQAIDLSEAAYQAEIEAYASRR